MVEIRKIRPEDTSQVKALIHRIMDEEFAGAKHVYTLQDIENPGQYYGGAKDVFLVAEKDGQIVGTVAIKEDAPGTALLRRVFVKKEYRGKGYGEKLLAKAIEFCFEREYQNVVFRGVDRMQSALRLCLKNGFEQQNISIADDMKLFVLTRRLRRDRVHAAAANA